MVLWFPPTSSHSTLLEFKALVPRGSLKTPSCSGSISGYLEPRHQQASFHLVWQLLYFESVIPPWDYMIFSHWVTGSWPCVLHSLHPFLHRLPIFPGINVSLEEERAVSFLFPLSSSFLFFPPSLAHLLRSCQQSLHNWSFSPNSSLILSWLEI